MPNSVKKIRLLPSPELRKIWKQWLAAYRWVYNFTISSRHAGNKLSSWSLVLLAKENAPNWVKTLPGHQWTEAVDDALDAYKQAFKAYMDKPPENRGTFKPKYKSCRHKSQAIQFKVGNFKNGTWYSRTKIHHDFQVTSPIPHECEYGTELVYQRGQWYGCFPVYIPEENTPNQSVIALDPGVRTFLTGYDGENVLEIGQGDVGRIQRLCSHLDQLISKRKKGKNRRQSYRLGKVISKLRWRIRDLVEEVHRKATKYLIDNYKVVFLPTFDTSEMVVKNRRKIRSKTARNMLTWSHYRFEMRLIQAAKRTGVIVVLCNESYTSKTCGSCGQIHSKLGGAKVYKCPNCGVQIPRDLNGARNIMIRALQASAFTVEDKNIILSDALALGLSNHA